LGQNSSIDQSVPFKRKENVSRRFSEVGFEEIESHSAGGALAIFTPNKKMVAFPGGRRLVDVGTVDLDVEHGRRAVYLYTVLTM
jgi:hypothetical protein